MKLFIILTVLYYVFAIILFPLGIFPHVTPYVLLGMYEGFTFFMLGTGLVLLRYFGFHGVRARTILTIVLGIICKVLGDITATVIPYLAHNGATPVPLGDVFYLLTYPFFLVGVMNELVGAHIRWKLVRRKLKIFLFLAAFLLIAIVAYVAVHYVYDPGRVFHTSIWLAYLISDSCLVVAAFFLLVLIWVYRGGVLARSWIYLFVGFLFNMFGDVFNGIFHPYNNFILNTMLVILSILYFTSNVFISYSFIVLIRSIRRIQKKLQR